MVGSAAAVWFASSLVWLTVAAQVLNAFLMPLVIGFLLALAATALPELYRLKGWYLALVACIAVMVSAVGVFGGVQALM